MWPTNPNNKHTLKTTTKSTVTLNINSRWERESHEWERSVGACQIFRFGVGQSRRQRRSGEVALQRSRDKNTHASPPRIHTNKCFCERGFLQPLCISCILIHSLSFSQQCFVTLFSLFTTYGLFLYIYVCTYIYILIYLYTLKKYETATRISTGNTNQFPLLVNIIETVIFFFSSLLKFSSSQFSFSTISFSSYLQQ